MTELRVGVSSCLLGQEVRFDGQHKRHAFVDDILGQYVTFVPVCPEVGIGLGIPRETIRLRKGKNGVELVGTKSEADHTRAMVKFGKQKTKELKQEDLSGYVFKKDSPSCGLFRVRVYNDKGHAEKNGRGIYAEQVAQAFPHLPMEEEGRLNDPRLRENFVERLFAYRRMEDLFATNWSRGDLVAFHSREKCLLMAHDLPAYRELGRIVAAMKGRTRKQIADEYRPLFMDGLSKLATARKHTNVLQHMAGHFKRELGKDDKSELQRIIEDYRQMLVPLIVPLTLIKHYVRKFSVDYLAEQSYLQPHPKELMLRNHV